MRINKYHKTEYCQKKFRNITFGEITSPHIPEQDKEWILWNLVGRGNMHEKKMDFRFHREIGDKG